MTAASGQRPASGDRVLAPFGRRACEVVANEPTGGYRLLAALDREGPEPEPGQFYMLTGERWGSEAGRPYLPRAFSVAAAAPGEGGLRLDFLLEAVGPGTRALASLAPGETLWVTGPLGRPFSGPAELAPGRRGGDPGRRRDRDRAARDPAPPPRRAGRRPAHPARLSRSRPLGRARALRLLGDPARLRGRPQRPSGLRHRPAGGAARGRRRGQRLRLCLWPAGDAGGGAGALRRARGRGRAGDGGADGMRVRLLLRLRGAARRRRLYAAVRGWADRERDGDRDGARRRESGH